MHQHLLKLGLYLSTLRHTKYEWGESDCNLFVADWVDQINNTQTAADIRHKYSDAVSAVRFARRYTPAPVWLSDQGYQQCICNAQHEFLSGDVLLQKTGEYYTAWIVLMSYAYSMAYPTGLVAQHAHQLTNYTHWRNKK